MLEALNAPGDIKNLNGAEIAALAEEMRHVILSTVSQTGGHLASNLGIVELTIALHQVFDSPSDRIIFDVGHQCYPHKLLTGRYSRFDTLRQMNGISGFTNRFESEHDTASEGHCGTSISVALGIAEANRILDNPNYAVAIVGDGALTNGMIYEALNNASNRKINLIVIINDNEMSISKNVGGLHRYLSNIRTSKRYFTFKKNLENLLLKIPGCGTHLAKACKKVKDLFKKLFVKNNIFEDLGCLYLGPVDGHNTERIKLVLEEAKSKKTCCVVHVLTQKGKGYELAEAHPESYHSVGKFDVTEGVTPFHGTTYSDLAGKLICESAEKDPRICAITAAMRDGTGLTRFSQEFPSRFFDVGIAEEHAITFAGGLSLCGMTPVVFLYSTFAQRSYDQLLHDIAIQRIPLVLMLDRAGIVPHDGITHQGIFDVPLLSSIPNVQIFSPETFKEMRYVFERAISEKKLSVIRYPKGYENDHLSKWPMEYIDTRSLAYSVGDTAAEAVILTYGRATEFASQIVNRFEGVSFGIIKLIRIFPLDPAELLPHLTAARVIVIMDEGIQSGGIGEKIAALLYGRTTAKLLIYSIKSFVETGSVKELIEKHAFPLDRIERELRRLLMD